MIANQNTNQVLVVKEKALQIVRSRGPLLPVQITKDLGVNVMFASAILSELVDSKVLKLSNTKVGGSPVYFVTGQEPKLQALRDKLNDKQQMAFDMLKQAKVLRDIELDPVIRVALRDIKDFAHQLSVTASGSSEIFWKWYLLSDAEAEPTIKEKLGIGKKQENKAAQKEVQKHLEEIEHNLRKLEEQKESLTKPIEHRVREEAATLPARQRKQKKAQEQNESLPAEKPVIDQTDKFMLKAMDFFAQNNIEVLSLKQIRKESDFEGVIKLPTAIGSVAYFLKAKNKQKITDADLSLLFVQSQIKKLPILLVTTGDVTKKAQDLLTKEFKNITIKKV